MPTTSNNFATDRRPASRLPRTPKATTSRRGSPAPSRRAGNARGDGAKPAFHITPNVIIATRGVWDFGALKRFAAWLTDGATDRPHLRF